MDISIAVCTYKRPELLKMAISSLIKQKTDLTFEIIVVDNDINQTAKPVINDALRNTDNIKIHYFNEPLQNISLARNRAVKESRGEFIAFVDDDEFAQDRWLQNMYATLQKYNFDAVFGPVVTLYPPGFSMLVQKSGALDRSRHTTGTIYKGAGRTGNALVKKQLLQIRPGPFNEEFGLTGGEDSDFFNWFRDEGYVIGWCDEAVVSETIGTERQALIWHLKRSYTGGCAHSHKLIKKNGLFKGLLYITASIFTGSLKSIYSSIKKISYPNLALFILIVKLSSQAGKLGCLFGIEIKSYEKKGDSTQ